MATAAVSSLEAVLDRGGSPVLRLLCVLLATLAAWVAYVPLHELLHVFGCVATGGEVKEVLIQPIYGGGLLERVLPFVRAGGDHAGRLTEFDTRGSDLIYLATDLAPFLFTVFGALPLLEVARRRRSAIPFGAGVVLAAAPLVSLTGDLYEMGSILVTAGLGLLPWGDGVGSLLALRRDDLMALVGEFGQRFPNHQALWASAIAASTLVGWLVGNIILVASRSVGERIVSVRAHNARVA